MGDATTLGNGERDALVELLCALLRFPTEDPPGREIELARWLAATLEADGFEVELDEFAPGRANVIARLRGAGARRALAFSAHLDTLPAGDAGAWTHPPFAAEIADGCVYGRGAADMKGGLAAMVAAARRVAAAGPAPAGDLVLAFSAGESSSCLGARRMVEAGTLADVGALLVSEPSSLRPLVAEKGAWWATVRARGAPGHASAADGEFGDGGNAILAIVDAVGRLRAHDFGVEAHPLLGAPTIGFGTVAGGTTVNLVPERAELGIDVRFLPGMEVEAMRASIAEAIGPALEIETLDVKAPVETPADHPFARLCSEACAARLGAPAVPGGVSYYSDSTVLCPALGIPRVVVGPGALGASGQRDEHVRVDALVAAAEIYAAVAVAALAGEAGSAIL